MSLPEGTEARLDMSVRRTNPPRGEGLQTRPPDREVFLTNYDRELRVHTTLPPARLPLPLPFVLPVKCFSRSGAGLNEGGDVSQGFRRRLYARKVTPRRAPRCSFGVAWV